jgi:hypothetical protein
MNADPAVAAPAVADAAAVPAVPAVPATHAPADVLHAVSIKLPPFWPADPALWFAQVESQFHIRGITSQRTRYHHIVGALTPDIASEVRDLLLQPPLDRPYDELKAAIFARTSESAQHRVQQLISGEELGDRKPSQLLRRMRHLVGDANVGDDLLGQLFLQRLPSNIRVILSGTADALPLEKQAELADKMHEINTPVLTTISKADQPEARDDPSSLRQAITTLQQQMADLSALIDHRSRHRSRSRARHKHPSTPRQRADSADPSTAGSSGECWYHRKYGNQARKCDTSMRSKAPLNSRAGQ